MTVELDLLAHRAHPGPRMRSGTWWGPRTAPIDQQMSAESTASSKRGKRRNQPLSATSVSMRARLEPMQRWMPTPKAMCGLTGPVEHDLVGPVELGGVAVRRGERQQQPLPPVDRAAADVGIGRDQPTDRRGSEVPQELLDRDRQQLGLGDQPRQIVRVGSQVPQRRADQRPRRVDPAQHQHVERSDLLLVGQRAGRAIALRHPCLEHHRHEVIGGPISVAPGTQRVDEVRLHRPVGVTGDFDVQQTILEDPVHPPAELDALRR